MAADTVRPFVREAHTLPSHEAAGSPQKHTIISIVKTLSHLSSNRMAIQSKRKCGADFVYLKEGCGEPIAK